MPVNIFLLIFGLACLWSTSSLKTFAETSTFKGSGLITGPRVRLKSQWVGLREVSKSIPILVMAGHADSQGLAGAGTSGSAVDEKGASPMDLNISDELFWNLRVRDSIVKLGLEKGLKISSYNPNNRNIQDGNDPRTNWSVGARHVRQGGYALEIHFDAYGEYGFGSGLIPAFTRKLNTIDESLANYFGRYPLFFRGGLGAPRRGIRILEIGKLEGKLEESLRDPNSREETINAISMQIVQALIAGIEGAKNSFTQ